MMDEFIAAIGALLADAVANSPAADPEPEQ